MKKLLLIATTVCMAACQNTPKNTGLDLANLDPSIAPQEDFYQYATGGWQKNNPLKPEYSRYGSFDVLATNNEKRINELFQQMTSQQTEKGTVEQKISDLYKMGLDSVRLNQEGSAPIQEAVRRILSVERRSELTPIIAQMHQAVANPIFSLGVMADMKDSNVNALYAEQSGLMLGNRDFYLKDENKSIIEAYKTYLQKIFTLTGIAQDEAAKAADEVIAFETKLAKDQWSNVEMRNMPALYNPMSRAEFEKIGSPIQWDEYYKILGLGSFDRIIVTTPSSIKAGFKLLESESLEAIRYYLAAHYINSAAGVMSDDYFDASFSFFGRVMSGKQEPKPRWKRAMATPNGILGQAVGKMYVEKYFPEKDKVRMTELVKNLQKSLSQHIDALDWMSDETKARAQEKLAAFSVKIGYPDTWKDYSSLEINPEKSYWENICEASRWQTRDNLDRLGKPVDRAEWQMSPQTVNAYYNPTTNEICFPAAILQPPFYNPEADDAVNYGAIGVVIGHEMTHGFDDQGRNFDKEGNMNNWWTDADVEAFTKKTQVLVDQFNAIEILPEKDGQPRLMANGALSLGENIADQGGLNVSYTALHNALGEQEDPMTDGFSFDQRFYLAYATLWGQNIRDEEAARLTKLDVHSLGKWRVNATLRNLQPFYDAFQIKEGHAMFLAEEDRVIIW